MESKYFIAKIIGWGGELQGQVTVLNTDLISNQCQQIKDGASVFFQNPRGGYSSAKIVHLLDDGINKKIDHTTAQTTQAE